jgi:predicted permease
MIAFVLLSLPIFGVVALGRIATRMRLAPAGAIDALSAFAFYFALPALVLKLIAGRPLDRSFNPVFYSGYLASG